MIIGWMFGSYLTSGYSTYLPKYIETQFGRSASVADIFAGKLIVSSIIDVLLKERCGLHCEIIVKVLLFDGQAYSS